MNDDRCQHVPTAPGQQVCTCLDTRMWLEFVIQVQSELISKLLAKQGHPDNGHPKIIINSECP